MNHQQLLADWRFRLIAFLEQHGEQDGAHDIHHLHRVWHAASQIMRSHPEADSWVVLSACYLHDLVNLPKDHPERHLASRMTALTARAHLERMGFPTEKLDAVAHAIEAHSFSAGIPPVSLEAKIVQDADRLDALGAIGLARLFYTARRLGSMLAHPTDPLAADRLPDDKAYALDHIACKLATLPATMQTEAGRLLGDARLARLMAFRDDFAREWLGTDASMN